LSAVLLTQAVTSGDAGVVKAVLANGADANERTGGGQTPLILATIFGHTHLIPLLLDAGADPQLRDNLGLNAFDWAQRRGATEAIDVLSNKTRPQSSPRVETRAPAGIVREKQSVAPAVEKPKLVSEEERSRRWIAGLKQRIAEQSQGEVPDGPNIFRPRPEPPPEVQARLTIAEREPQPEQPAPAPEPQPEIPAAPPDPQPEMPAELPEPQPESPGEPPEPESQAEVAALTAEAEVSRPPSGRKRCPKCNAIYNSPLVAYCAHHIVPLVDADAPPIISEPSKQSPVLFWMIVAITLTGSIVVGSLFTAYFYNTSEPAPEVVASQPQPSAVQKGSPVVGRELEGKVVSLPVAECPLNGQEAIPGTVVVRVAVGRDGQVKTARASGGDWLLRDAATEAARKSTFAPEKLRGRDIEGTITYTFEP